MKKLFFIFIALLIIGAAAFQGCSLFGKKYEKSVNVSYNINVSDKKDIRFEATTGRIKIFSSVDSLAHVIVKGEFSVRKRDLDNIKEENFLKIDSTGQSVLITEDLSGNIRSGIFHFGRESDISFEIYVPNFRPLKIEATNCSMDINEIYSDIDAEAINGNIKVNNPAGNTEIKLTNGKLTGQIDSLKNFSADLLNGKISLKLGNKFSGQVDCTAENGSVKVSPATVETVDIEKKNTFIGKTGTSDAKVKLTVMNGKINLSSEKQKINEDN